MPSKSIWSCEHVALSASVRAGMKVELPMVSAISEDPKKEIPFKDIVVDVPYEMTMASALELAEGHAREYVRSYGATDIRQYFIEDVIISSTQITFIWGS
ncbi:MULTISPECIES: hypothetical protein [Vibrio]|nr:MULTISPECIES: hypothetical protein [Vibrio]EHU8077668.1 hypothetical protein [Vibrio cholerae]EHV9953724.1 hypothetical protein [Vibrio cholerae]EKF9218949.1 hypothetical protein [Vibrio cholerae]OQK43800.1 hypothetical protein XM75_u0081 [Vibrio vulnificus]PAS33385.1 hypothetical protein CGT72_09980 [Vibrio cholerae]